MRPCWIGRGPNPAASSLQGSHAEAQQRRATREEHHVTAQASTGVTRPQAKECQAQPATASRSLGTGLAQVLHQRLQKQPTLLTPVPLALRICKNSLLLRRFVREAPGHWHRTRGELRRYFPGPLPTRPRQPREQRPTCVTSVGGLPREKHKDHPWSAELGSRNFLLSWPSAGLLS